MLLEVLFRNPFFLNEPLPNNKNLLADEKRHLKMWSQLESIITEAEQGNYARLRRLLLEGTDINQRDMAGCTATLKAAAGGHMTCLQLLWDLGGDINIPDDWNQTPLLWACIGVYNYSIFIN